MMLASGFMTKGQVAIIGSSTLFGLAAGCAGQGEFTGRFGLATVAAAFAPNYIWLALLRFVVGVGPGAEQPLCLCRRVRAQT
jgi:hypothetical protein